MIESKVIIIIPVEKHISTKYLLLLQSSRSECRTTNISIGQDFYLFSTKLTKLEICILGADEAIHQRCWLCYW